MVYQMWIMPNKMSHLASGTLMLLRNILLEKFIQINKQKNTEDINPTCKEIPKIIFQLYILLNTINYLEGFKMHNIIGALSTLENLSSGTASNKGADQTAHPCCLISAFVIHLLESIISRLAMSEISIFWFESHFVGNPEDRFSCVTAFIILYST